MALGDPLSVSLDASHHKEQEYICLRVWHLNDFPDIWPFMKTRGWSMPPGDPQAVSLDVSHNEKQYIMLRAGDLHSF